MLKLLALMFEQTRKSAEWLAGKMNREGHAVALITGDSTTDQRIAVLNRFAGRGSKLVERKGVCACGGEGRRGRERERERER